MMINSDANYLELSEKLAEFLFYFQSQDEVGLIVVDDAGLERYLANELKRHDFAESRSWIEMLNHLEQNESTFVVLYPTFSKELYDAIVQYRVRSGTIQIMDRRSIELRTAKFQKHLTRLLLLTTRSTLQKIEEKFAIHDKVGIIERFERSIYAYA